MATVQLGNSVSDEAKGEKINLAENHPYLNGMKLFHHREELRVIGQKEEIVSSNPFEITLPPNTPNN